MKFENEKLSATFTVPDRLTVRQWLAYMDAVGPFDAERYVRAWRGAMQLITSCECPFWPEPDAEVVKNLDPKQALLVKLAIDFDQVTDIRIGRVVQWIGGAVASHVAMLDEVPKN